MGTYRLFLAVMVFLSHAEVRIHGYNQGVVAVISFLMISGYVMTILTGKHYATASRIVGFYVDRTARIVPQFMIYMLLTLVCIPALNLTSVFIQGCDVHKIALNLLLIPLNYFLMNGLVDCMLIPQAWSLGLEVSFYAVVPFVIVFGSPCRHLALAAVSIAVFCAAYAGIIDTDNFGYRLLPGTLFMFMAGASFAVPDARYRLFPWVVWLIALGLLIETFVKPSLAVPFNREVLMGLAIGVPALHVLTAVRFRKWDAFLGDLSYGVFLNHSLFIWLLMPLLLPVMNKIVALVMVFSVSAAFALASYILIEKPALRFRRAVRYRSASRRKSPSLRLETGSNSGFKIKEDRGAPHDHEVSRAQA